MFEAVTTAAWFGAFFALMFEMFLPRSPVRGIVALGGAGTGMVALMCAHFMPLSLDPTISNMMPVLHDVWLYIHTNVIIFSYALIFMASVTAGIYLLWRGALRLPVNRKAHSACGWWRHQHDVGRTRPFVG